LSGIKTLAKQTAWYGASNILSRFLNYLLTPLLTSVFASADYGKISTLFAYAAFLNIIFTYGLETAYFRFIQQEPEKKVYNTAFSSILISTLLITSVLWFSSDQIASFLEVPSHPEYVRWMLLIVAFDTFAVLPFSKLRHKGRPVKFAFVKSTNIIINIGFVLFFLYFCKNSSAGSYWSDIYNPEIGVGYVLLANLFASIITLVLLTKEIVVFRWELNLSFWKTLMKYSWPLLIVGFGGMINEMIDRFMLLKLYTGSSEEALSQIGIYSANYKLAVLIVIFIQTFRMGAEPFFFSQSASEDAPKIYSRIMKFFVIACCFCFLGVTLFLDVWKYFMGSTHKEYWNGLLVVPVLMLSKIFLGIYYNLSVWYKVTNKNLIGAWITITGVLVTALVNFFLIPYWGYWACATATVCCYGWMMIVSAMWGQKYYPVPYPWAKIILYITISIGLFFCYYFLREVILPIWVLHLASLGLCLIFLLVVFFIEKDEFRKFPVVGRFFQR
jgi:O-antigen/teichoic acid export membrane protein